MTISSNFDETVPHRHKTQDTRHKHTKQHTHNNTHITISPQWIDQTTVTTNIGLPWIGQNWLAKWIGQKWIGQSWPQPYSKMSSFAPCSNLGMHGPPPWSPLLPSKMSLNLNPEHLTPTPPLAFDLPQCQEPWRWGQEGGEPWNEEQKRKQHTEENQDEQK